MQTVPIPLRTLSATRYVTPLREGGSMPAIIEAEDDGLYVLKFRGAGQGPKALIAELVAGEIARALGLPVPEIVFVLLDPDLARTEPDAEIQHLMRASAGLNIALDYLPGSAMYDPVVNRIDATLASDVVWFDAFVRNVDRTARNANLLMWHRQLQLIDHGAALYFHHDWEGWRESSTHPFPMIRQHVLLPFATDLAAADARMTARLDAAVIEAIVNSIPDSWLGQDAVFVDAAAQRDAYRQSLLIRLEAPHAFAEEAIRARSAL